MNKTKNLAQLDGPVRFLRNFSNEICLFISGTKEDENNENEDY
jgi:hypothetical protein